MGGEAHTHTQTHTPLIPAPDWCGGSRISGRGALAGRSIIAPPQTDDGALAHAATSAWTPLKAEQVRLIWTFSSIHLKFLIVLQENSQERSRAASLLPKTRPHWLLRRPQRFVDADR